MGLAPREQPVIEFNLGRRLGTPTKLAESQEYLSCAEPHHEVGDECVLSLPRAVAHHHPPAIRLSQFAAGERGHFIRPKETASVGKPMVGWGFSLFESGQFAGRVMTKFFGK